MGLFFYCLVCLGFWFEVVCCFEGVEECVILYGSGYGWDYNFEVGCGGWLEWLRGCCKVIGLF